MAARETHEDRGTRWQATELRQRALARLRGGIPVWGEAIDGASLLRAALGGQGRLRAKRERVNALNVFPVPDGDTGTNMVLTMQAACDKARADGTGSAAGVAAALAQGALMGARGNSGVILSQLWRGLALGLEGCQEIRAEDFARALRLARDTAYQGVLRPVEGTILTVATDAAAEAGAAVGEGLISVVDLLERVVRAAEQSVRRTPDLLPVLKQAGVVDSGGAGLFYILEGMLRSAYGEKLEDDQPEATTSPRIPLGLLTELEEGQDWEVVVDIRLRDGACTHDLQGLLDPIGTSLQIGEGDGVCRVHVHLAEGRQYEVVEVLRGVGTVLRAALENLRDQVEAETRDAPRPAAPARVQPGQTAAVVVASGEGFIRLVTSLGAAAVVEGGPLMNPSVQSILEAVSQVPTDRVVLLPNDPNVLQAARQAAQLSHKQVAVVPAKSVPQGIAALIALDPEEGVEQVAARMTEALGHVRTGELARATRSVRIDGVDVVEGQVIGIIDGALKSAADQMGEALLSLLAAVGGGEAELLTIYYGAGVLRGEAEGLGERARRVWPRLEVEVLEGGQPHRPIVFSLE